MWQMIEQRYVNIKSKWDYNIIILSLILDLCVSKIWICMYVFFKYVILEIVFYQEIKIGCFRRSSASF